MADYAASGDWRVSTDAAGHQSMVEAVETIPGAVADLRLEAAANYASGYSAATVTVF